MEFIGYLYYHIYSSVLIYTHLYLPYTEAIEFKMSVLLLAKVIKREVYL